MSKQENDAIKYAPFNAPNCFLIQTLITLSYSWHGIFELDIKKLWTENNDNKEAYDNRNVSPCVFELQLYFCLYS